MGGKTERSSTYVVVVRLLGLGLRGGQGMVRLLLLPLLSVRCLLLLGL